MVDAAIGLLLSLFVLGSYALSLPFLESLELKAFDIRSKLRQTAEPSPEVILVSIDDSSLAQIGRWPWPRWRLAELVDKLATAKPKVIGFSILFSEEQRDEGLKEIERLQQQYDELVVGRKIVEKGVWFSAEFSSSVVRLDTDSRFLGSIRSAENVVLPMFFDLGGVKGAKPEALPPSISSSVVTHNVVRGAAESEMPDGSRASFPLVKFAQASLGVGHVNVYTDIDGVVRREIPVVKYDESYYPSYALRLVLAYLGVPASQAAFTPGVKVSAGKLDVPLDSANGMFISFVGPAGTFRSYSFQDVMNDKVSMDAFKGKIVVVGLTAEGVGTRYVTPAAPSFPSIELTASVIDNILHGKFLTRPPWATRLELGLLGFVALFVMLGLPRLRAIWGNVLFLLILLGILGAGTVLFVHQGFWIKITYPMTLLVVGFLVVIAKKFLITEKGKELVEASAIETNKLLGLSFQGQGMLDLAFEKFRLCPVDDNMKETLYNLSLDYERKRQYSKAASVLEHVGAKDPAYKDIQEKIKVLKAAGEGAVFGGVGQTKKEGTVMIAGGATKPTLGRYEIEKELGRGAMGIVYLGRDPKINRMVAIKTMMMEEGSDAAAVKEIKERFFREAESAGTLNHPNIIRIFDAGEEQDVCYIAMELLDGEDLVRFASKDSLLPPLQAMEYVALVADALDYAHGQGIVHRDIKPANIMLLKNGTIRVADFGIARITSSSKTATGTVMGTPSYMSPEQVAGKKVDGRSDLFSLTVALFEFVTGEKPFKGGEGIGTLLFQIANDPHPSPLSVRPDLPPGIAPIIDKGMAKNADQRYARGSLLAADLRALIAAVKSGKAGEPVPQAPPSPAIALPPPPAAAPVRASAVVVQPEPQPGPAPDAPSGAGGDAAAEAPAPHVDEGLPIAPRRSKSAPTPEAVAPVQETAGLPEPAAPALTLEPIPAAEPAPEAAVPALPSEVALAVDLAAPASGGAPPPAPDADKTIVSPGSLPRLELEPLTAAMQAPSPVVESAAPVPVEPEPPPAPVVEAVPSPEPDADKTIVSPGAMARVELEPLLAAIQSPAPVVESAAPAAGAADTTQPDVSPLPVPEVVVTPVPVEPQPFAQIVLEPRAAPAPAPTAEASDKTVVLAPGSVPSFELAAAPPVAEAAHPDLDPLPATEAVPAPVAPAPVEPEPQPAAAGEFQIMLEPRATLKPAPKAEASDKTVVLAPGSVPSMEPAAAPPAAEPAAAGEFQIMLEPRATLKPAPKAAASDKTVVLTPGSVPSMEPAAAPPAAEPAAAGEFQIVLERRATFRPAPKDEASDKTVVLAPGSLPPIEPPSAAPENPDANQEKQA
ncbi:MAG: CHASE2 domain-containing protein [Elusimicrobia bacterium]|nr:CHASE2 domain-containing protein [Elusimicrobiota bacterium]